MSITYWPAKASFNEKEKGKIKVGMFADFVIIDKNIMECSQEELLKTKILGIWINGERIKE